MQSTGELACPLARSPGTREGAHHGGQRAARASALPPMVDFQQGRGRMMLEQQGAAAGGFQGLTNCIDLSEQPGAAEPSLAPLRHATIPIPISISISPTDFIKLLTPTPCPLSHSLASPLRSIQSKYDEPPAKERCQAARSLADARQGDWQTERAGLTTTTTTTTTWIEGTGLASAQGGQDGHRAGVPISFSSSTLLH